MGSYEIVNIVICYKNSNEVIDYINQFKNFKSIEALAFVIVINDALDEDIIKLKTYAASTNISVIIYNPNCNLGYLNGMIFGYREYRKTYECPKYLIMSNTDILIKNINHFKLLLNKKYDNELGCIGPSVYVEAKDTYDNPVCIRRRSLAEINRIIFKFSIPIFRGFYVYLSTIKGKYIKRNEINSQRVYEVHGCYFIMTGKFSEILSNHVYGSFMYSEESYIAELIYENGFFTFYDKSLQVIHMEHAVTKLVKCEKIAIYILASMKYIRKTFYKK